MLRLLLIFSFIFSSYSSFAAQGCSGKFLNPITGICWSCILPITLGGGGMAVKINFHSGTKSRDIEGPKVPLCLCNKKYIPSPGAPIGFWEPIGIVEVVRNPLCLVSLGGLKIGGEGKKMGGRLSKKGDAFYHAHYFKFPVIAVLELLLDMAGFMCFEQGDYDLAYMSEFDPTWSDDSLMTLMNPEVVLFANPIAQASCIGDCAKANVSFGLDSMFWCAGCLGSMYPLSGWNSSHVGAVQSSQLIATRVLFKMQRLGLLKETSTNTSSVGTSSPICKKRYRFNLKKSQYKLQMTYPKYVNNSFACTPLGMSDVFFGAGKEFPIKGEDFAYMVFQKTNCCLNIPLGGL